MIGVAFLGGQCYFSNPSSLSAGLAFILRPGLTPESCVFLEIVKGRFISLELVINNFNFTLFNVYAPCESAERRAFFASVIYTYRQLIQITVSALGVILTAHLIPK